MYVLVAGCKVHKRRIKAQRTVLFPEGRSGGEISIYLCRLPAVGKARGFSLPFFSSLRLASVLRYKKGLFPRRPVPGVSPKKNSFLGWCRCQKGKGVWWVCASDRDEWISSLVSRKHSFRVKKQLAKTVRRGAGTAKIYDRERYMGRRRNTTPSALRNQVNNRNSLASCRRRGAREI